MKIYISGISGTGMGPLALLAHDAGFTVSGSDLHQGDIFPELEKTDIDLKIGPDAQDGDFLQQKIDQGLDWFVYTSALPEDHPELKLARSAGLKISKRDDFTAFLIEHLGLKLVAVAGTHGKTTTTSMLIWAATQLKIPASYIVGSTLSFAPSGAYHKGDQFFIYEADEYDRNFLKFHPWLAVIPAVSYDHPDIYKTKADYTAAFDQFRSQSKFILDAKNLIFAANDFALAGPIRRFDASLAASAIAKMLSAQQKPASFSEPTSLDLSHKKIIGTLNHFPGVGRRFERIAPGIYSDYAHHPEEISATVAIARDAVARQGFSGLTVLYQPHQNSRQHEVQKDYRHAFDGVDQLLWLPTYLARENPNLKTLTPEDLIQNLANPSIASPVDFNDDLIAQLKTARQNNHLIVLMSAGTADAWLRQNLKKIS